MTDRRAFTLFRAASFGAAVGLLFLIIARVAAQAPSLTLLSADGRRTLPLVALNGREFVALDDLATAFGLSVREEAGAITVSYRANTIVLNPSQPLASVAGRLISLPAAPARSSGRIVVPLEFISRALAVIHDVRMDLRPGSHLLVLGTLRVPRVVVGQQPLDNAARLTIDTTPRTATTITQDANTLTVRFDADALDISFPDALPTGFVREIRMPDAVTLLIDLGPRFAAYRPDQQAADSPRRVIDLLALNAAVDPAPADPSASLGPAPPPPTGALPNFGDPVVPLSTVVIDPGHGGEDLGVQGGNGTLEKDVTLAIAQRLKAVIEARLGIRVLLTRDDDRSIPLDRRTAVANNNKADVFLSLHVNASPRAGASGASVRTAKFSEAERARASLASERLPVVGGRVRDIDLVLWDVAQVRHVDRSTELAAMIARHLDGRVPLDARPLGAEPLRVLEAANMPAVVVEVGYLTNPEQAAVVGGGQFQGAVAQALFEALLEFRALLSAGEGER
ncbi:MAG: N-acetylmuramoyl-L-alanine amidase [Vicinamibacterales bacterium]